MKAYPSYKNSGIVWIQEIPNNWACGQLKYKLASNDGGVWGDETSEDGEEGTIVLRSTEITVDGQWNIQNPARRNLNLTEIEKSLLKTGDLLITKSSGSEAHIGKTALVTPEIQQLNACYSNFMQRVHPQQDMESRFLYFFMNSAIAREQFNYFSTTTTGLANLNSAIIGNLLAPFPSFSEQKAIADYLDRKTTQIDTLIAKKQRQIELLQEQRTTIINQAVTKGLNPSVSMKDSIVEWIGEVPSHWRVGKLAYFVEKITNGYVGPTRDIFFDEGVRYIQSLHIKNNSINFHKPYYVSEEWSNQHERTILRENDVLVVQTGSIGEVGIVSREFDGANCHALIILRMKEKFGHGMFLMYSLSSNYGYHSILSIMTGALQPHVNTTYLRDVYIAIPPKEEQLQIIRHITKKIRIFDAVISNLQKDKTLLNEYRTALISEAVTGKIDVRGEA